MVAPDSSSGGSEVEVILAPGRKRRRRIDATVVIDLEADCNEKLEEEEDKPQFPEIHDWRERRHQGLNLRENPHGGKGKGSAARRQRHELIAYGDSESSDSASDDDIDSDWGELNLAAQYNGVVPADRPDLHTFRCPVRGCLKVFDFARERDEHVGLLHKESREAFEIRSRVFAKEVDEEGVTMMVAGVRCPRPLLRYYCPGFTKGNTAPLTSFHPALEQAIADEVTRHRPLKWSLVRICAAFITALRVEQKIRGVPLRGMERLVNAVYKEGMRRLEGGRESRHTSREALRGMFSRPPAFDKVQATEARAMVLLLYRFSSRLER